jgi:DNA-binding CsgD family transcriptional regulator
VVSRATEDRGTIRSLHFFDPARNAARYIGRPIASLLADFGAQEAQLWVRSTLDGTGGDVASVELRNGGRTFVVVTSRLASDDTLRVTVRHFDGQVLRGLFDARVARLAERSRLSCREREVLGLLLLGHSPDDTAIRLRIAPRTVKFHQGNILAKLGAESRFDLIRVIMS